MIGDSDVGLADHRTLVHPVGLSWAKSTFGVLRWSPQNSQTLCSYMVPGGNQTSRGGVCRAGDTLLADIAQEHWLEVLKVSLCISRKEM